MTKQLIESRFLGVLQSFDYEFGTAGGWASVSGYNLVRSMSGGGVLVVSGSHFIDRMLYFFDEVEVISYADDSRGGPEANCLTRFRAYVKGEQLEGHITLSKTHWLANRLRIIGEKGALEVGEGQSRSVNYLPARSPLQHAITYSSIANTEVEEDYFLRQLDDFVRAIKTGTPRVDGEQASKSVALMERCYEIARPLQEPWCDAILERLKAALPESATAPASSQPSPNERP
jgi:predicted dehydrogenase